MATKTIDPAVQLIVNQVRALVDFHLEQQRGAGHTPAEIVQDRAALVAAIVEMLRARQGQP
jgi:hypothetical protein